MEFKAKKKQKTKNEKENNLAFNELATINKAMGEGYLLKDEAQSLRELLEEEVKMALFHKTKKKKGKDGARLNKVLVQEKTPSPIAQDKGKIEANMVLLVKKPPWLPRIIK